MELIHELTIAVDGLSSCGKSTFAKAIAHYLGYGYVDSGAMYRAVTLYALRKGWIAGAIIEKERIIAHLPEIEISFLRNKETGANETYLNGEYIEEAIRTLEVSAKVSEISAIPEVRRHMVKLQQTMGKNRSIVMDGRDIGTVVFPDADIKIFMTASPEVRAQRRWLEQSEKGMRASLNEIKENLLYRDRLDQAREEGPLRQAGDALVLDNSCMTPPDQMKWFLEVLNRFSKQKG
ncbi:MAG: (d)CMP kinase [Bacteroidales bacterium]